MAVTTVKMQELSVQVSEAAMLVQGVCAMSGIILKAAEPGVSDLAYI